MSDEAVVWKAGFGALVLVFCGLTVALRKSPPPAPVVAPQVVVAPVDADEETPPRIEVVIEDPPPHPTFARLKAHLKPQRRPRHAVPPRIHRVVTERRSYVAARPHYPFEPRDRWNSREMP
ncbi:MAG TPA: hypothetical protein VMZ74_00325 [Ramlibacter sp.]|nr:hypothetical protein [Ramlibacter sp.]